MDTTEKEVDLRPAGPGAVDTAITGPSSSLEGASEYEYVEIFNPLSVTFIGKFGITKPVNIPMQIRSAHDAPGITHNEEDVRRNYGLDLRNPDHRGTSNIINKVEIPSGKSIRLLGNEAQVVVNQLVTAILQRQGKQLLLADPSARFEVEQMVIKNRGYLQDILGAPVSVQDQLHQNLNKLGDLDEPEFPDANQPERGSTASGGAISNTSENSALPNTRPEEFKAVDSKTNPDPRRVQPTKPVSRTTAQPKPIVKK